MSKVFEGIKGVVQSAWAFIGPIFQRFVGAMTGGEGGVSGVVNSAQKMQLVFMVVLKIHQPDSRNVDRKHCQDGQADCCRRH